MKVIKPPQTLQLAENYYSVFLAGSIEMGLAEPWQAQLEFELQGLEHICILNPRRNTWNPTWEQSIENPLFVEQVNWELEALEKADLVVFYFSPTTKSPVSMLELGLMARHNKVMVCCPNGFWRKGNIDIVCARYCIQQVNTLHELIDHIKQNSYEN